MNISDISFFFESKKRFLRACGIFITFSGWFFFLFKQFSELPFQLLDFSVFGLLFSLIFSTTYFLLLAFAWAIILHKLVARTRPKKDVIYKSMRAWLLTIMTRYLPGNVWHILSRAAFSQQLNVGKINLISISTLEQGLTVLGAALVASLFFSLSPLRHYAQDWFYIRILLAFFSLGTLIFIHPSFFGPALRYVVKKIKRPELNWQFDYGSMLLFVLLYSFSAFSAGLSLTSVLIGLGVADISNHLLFIIGSSSLAWLIGYLSFLTPSGLGVREGVLTALLAFVYPLPIAILGSLVFRIVCTLGEVIALVSFLLFNRLFVPFEKKT